MKKLKKFYERWFLNPKAVMIYKSMKDNPQNWKNANPYSSGEYPPFRIGNNGLEIWVASGHWFIDIHAPEEEKLGLLGRYIVWWGCRKIIKNLYEKSFKKNESLILSLDKEKK